MNDKHAQEISNKLSALIALALAPEPHKKNAAQKITLLARFGLGNQEIADIVGTTKGTVQVLKSRARGNKG